MILNWIMALVNYNYQSPNITLNHSTQYLLTSKNNFSWMYVFKKSSIKNLILLGYLSHFGVLMQVNTQISSSSVLNFN